MLIDGERETGDGWPDLLGPVVSSTVAAELLGLTPRQVNQARVKSEVLGIRTTTGRWVYPLRQFRRTSDGQAEVLAGLSEVLHALDPAGRPAGAARWLATPNRLLGGASPWEAVAGEGNDVVEAAHAQSRTWVGR